MAAQVVVVGERSYTVRTPRWSAWTGALERAAGDSARLLEECLLTCVEGLTIESVRSLPAAEGDRLMAAALQALEEERAALRFEVLEGAEEWRIQGGSYDLRLHPWTFGERNEALRRSLRLQAGQIAVDLSTYELMMLQTCVSATNGERLTPEQIAEWPKPLGELVIQSLDRLNGLEVNYTAVLDACVREGRDHPDLALLYLCQHFGWRPEQVERLDARLAQRLLAALKVVERGRTQSVAAALDGEGVNRIIVEDS